MTYWTWSGHNGELPTEHHFDYGLLNLWEDGLTREKHWTDRDPPRLKKEVLDNIKAWGGDWYDNALSIIFYSDTSATLWKLTYPSKSGCTSPDKSDHQGVMQGSGIK